MGYRETMARCDEYIDANRDHTVTALELAQLSGYSLYHFCHVFRAFHGVSPGEYLRTVRLRRAAEEIVSGTSVIDAAVANGYDSPASFARAFSREFGMSPTNYRKYMKGVREMNVKVEKLNEISAIGYMIKPASEVDILESGAFWCGKDFKNLPKYPVDSKELGEVGLWIHPAEISGELSYFFGPIVAAGTAVPEGFEALTIPAAQYAIFEVPASSGIDALAAGVKNTWKYAFKEWLADSDYVFDEGKICFEYYTSEKAQVCVPVKAK